MRAAIVGSQERPSLRLAIGDRRFSTRAAPGGAPARPQCYAAPWWLPSAPRSAQRGGRALPGNVGDRTGALRALDRIGSPLLILAFLLIAALEWRRPLRRQVHGTLGRVARNLVLSLPSVLVMRAAMLPLPLAIAARAERARFGLLHALRLPRPLAAAVGVVLMDYLYYWWHVALHRDKNLWRLHQVHHTDLDMDVSTAVRFHFGEMVLTTGLYAASVPLIGLSPGVFVLFLVIFELAVQFQHSNWRLPLQLERVLNRALVTPRMHGIHHSIVQRETDANWGTVFPWWDVLHRTLRRDVPQGELTIGVPGYRDERELTVGDLLAMPFRRPRPWRLPDGRVPERGPEGMADRR